MERNVKKKRTLRISRARRMSVRVSESNTPPPRTDTGPVNSGLRLRSAAGAWLLFGVILLLIGISITVVGYQDGKSLEQTGVRTTSGTLKLIGPAITGVALFTINCANAILRENRDRANRWRGLPAPYPVRHR